MDGELCSKCQAMLDIISEEDPEWTYSNIWDNSSYMRGPEFTRLCHWKFSDIESGVSTGCVLCSKLQAWLLKHGTQSEYEGLDFSAYPNVTSSTWKFRIGVSQGNGEKLSNDDPSLRLTFTCHPLDPDVLDPDYDASQCYHGFGRGDDTLTSTGSARSLDRVRYWLQTCVNSHQRCTGDADPAVYPPRLLNLREGRVQLIVDTSNMKETPYAALSHSWGPNPQQLLLTTDNHSALSERIDEAALPPTFRDAIHITRELKIDYLWIDSLCIIQRGGLHVQDWLGHSAIMGSIYQNCAVNIAAADGHDARAGCFVSRNTAEIAPCVVSLQKVTAIASADEDDPWIKCDENLTPHLLVPEPLLSGNVGQFHLDSRGWVCQERLLSPRTIYFTKDQLFWECSGSQNVCETVPEGVSNKILPPQDEFLYGGDAIGADFGWGTMKFDEIFPPYSWKAPDPKQQYDWWLKTVHGYVRRNLTKYSDKLPAIGGIAQRTAKVLNDEYWAGMFRSHLPDALLWSCVRERRPTNAKNMDNFFAPSWSWAGLHAELDFTPLAEENNKCLCAVVGSKIELVDPENPYGQAVSASLTLRGPFLSFDRKLLDNPKNWVYHFGQLKLKGFASKKQLLYFDFDPCTLDCSSLALLVIRENARPSTYPGSGDMEEAGLVLAPIVGDGQERFIRIGVFKGVEYYEEDRKKKYKRYAEVTVV